MRTTAISHALLCHRWLLFFWEIAALNVVFRLSSANHANYYVAGCWVTLSLAVGLSWLARRHRRPALRYAAAAGVVAAIVLLGLAMKADRAAQQTQHQYPISTMK